MIFTTAQSTNTNGSTPLKNTEQIRQVCYLIDILPEQVFWPVRVSSEGREQDMFKLPRLLVRFFLCLPFFSFYRSIGEWARRVEESEFSEEGQETPFLVFPVNLSSAHIRETDSVEPHSPGFRGTRENEVNDQDLGNTFAGALAMFPPSRPHGSTRRNIRLSSPACPL